MEVQATTHWAAHGLLRFYGATPVLARVVVDGPCISTAGVTAGLDGAIMVASLPRGNEAAEAIQLNIEYAPEPIFHSGTPEAASENVLDMFLHNYGTNQASRAAEARRFAERLSMPITEAREVREPVARLPF
jgi:cyclohexyl-isocyanide hydratase